MENGTVQCYIIIYQIGVQSGPGVWVSSTDMILQIPCDASKLLTYRPGYRFTRKQLCTFYKHSLTFYEHSHTFYEHSHTFYEHSHTFYEHSHTFNERSLTFYILHKEINCQLSRI